jgi:hypothetical protein
LNEGTDEDAGETNVESNDKDDSINLTKGGRRRIGNLVDLKDTPADEAIRSRGGGGSQINQIGNLRGEKVGDLANRAAGGDKAAETAIKIIKQAGKKAQKYGGK